MTSAERHPQRPPPSVALDQLVTGYWVSQALYVAAKLGVADQLKDGSRGVDELASALGAHAGALYRLLRALASLGVFTEVESRQFALTPMGACLRAGVPGSMRALVLYMDLDREAWGQLEHSVRTGDTAFDHIHGMGFFDYLQQHPAEGKLFDEAMTGYVSQNTAAVIAAYDFTRFSKIIDVGGGHGALMNAILKASPESKGVIFDQSSVVEGAKKKVEAAGLSARCECVGGDFFVSVPAGGDAYTMASIIHDWDDARAIAILKNCRRAMSGEETLLLIELVIPPGDAPFFGKLLDLEMLVVNGGRERTEAEYQALLAAAGFRLTRVVPTYSLASVIEATAV